jgi:anti-sigma B factor antagonist
VGNRPEQVGSASGDGAPEPFRCDVEPERDAMRVVAIGELDIATAPILRERIRELEEVGFEQIVLDLNRLTFIDSTGIRRILQARTAASENGVAVALIPGPPAVQRVFEIAGVTDIVSWWT